MIALLNATASAGTALLVGAAAGGFLLTVRVRQRWERRKGLMARHSEPCRRCGARN